MASEAFLEGYPARDLRDAMDLYGLPGIADIGSLEDMRGDDGQEGGHDTEAFGGEGLLQALQKYNCICGQAWLCNRPPASALKGDFGWDDGLEADSCTGDELTDYIGAIAMGIDAFALDDFDDFGADDDFEADDGFYQLAADALVAGALGQDELMALGWDPFKAVKKAVKKVGKTVAKGVKAVAKPIGKVHSAITGAVMKPLSKVVGAVTTRVLPKSIRNLGNAVIRSAIATTNPAHMLNPKQFVKNQLAVVKAAVPVAKTLVKSPLVKTVVGGAAIVFPPIGLPAAAALAATSAIAAAVDSKLPGVRAAAEKVVSNTARLIAVGKKAKPNSPAAKTGKGAELALAQIAQAKKALTLDKASKPSVPGARRLIHEVQPNGRIVRVNV